MTFLNSIFLAALAAITIPLLIHFLSRRRIKIVDFSSLRFLMTMQKSKLRWLKILELLLLIIRMMIIALIALAFARPAFTGKHASSHAPASIVLLIDDSPSLECLSAGGTLLDDLKRGASSLIDILKTGDEVTLITLAGQQSVEGPYSDFNRAKSVVNSIQTGSGTADIKTALGKASDILEGSHNLNREIYLLSDFQNGDWWNGSFEDVINDNYRYFALKYDNPEIENIGINKIEFPPQLLAPGEEFEIKALLKNYDDRAVSGRLLEIFIDGQKRAQTTVDLKPHGTAETGFSIVPEQPGDHRGYFQLEDDDYSLDNRYYFNFNIPQKIEALGVSETPQAARMLYNILGRTETGYIDFTNVNMTGFSQKNLREYDVVILNDIKALSAGNFNTLADFVRAGNGLFVILGPECNIDSYKNFLADKAGIIVTKPAGRNQPTTSEAYYTLDDFDLTHPIFNIYAPRQQESPNAPTIKLYTYNHLEGGHTLGRVESSIPVMSLSANNRMLIAGFGLDRNSSDLAVHSFIVPFMIRSVEYLAAKPAASEEFYISGKSINLNLPAELTAAAVTLSRHTENKIASGNAIANENETVEVHRGAYGAYLNIPRAGYPGFYSLTSDSDTVAVFAVNYSSEESSRETVDPDFIKEKLGNDIVFIDGQTDIADAVMQAKFGFELWKYCLLLALVLLMVESVLVRKAR